MVAAWALAEQSTPAAAKTDKQRDREKKFIKK